MSDWEELPQSDDFSARIKYSDLTSRLEKIHNAKSLKEKTDKLGRFIDSIKQFREKFISEGVPNAKASFYPILRLILPSKDTERAAYGIKTKTLGNLYVKALAINKHSSDGRKLNGEDVPKKGDFADVVFDVMKDRQPQGTLTIYDVNKCLDSMSARTTDTDADIVRAIRGMSALDCKWFTRIILKKLDLRIGFQRIMQLYHSKAFDCYNQYSLLSRTCEIIESGNPIDKENQNQSHIEIFKPMRPMLCERGKIAEIDKKLTKDDYYLETKMDGERCHIHISGKDYKYFSRSCHDDSTKVFGADFSGGLFSPVLHRLLGGKFESAIFDGEMMVWDREKKVYVTKTEKATARFLHLDDTRQNPCFCIYDLIYLNGTPLVNIPYAERIRKLRSLVTETPGQLTLCNRVKIRDAEHFLECVNKAFDEKEEGVVIKRAESIYLPGKREGGGWFKIKPDYENNLIVDFDLLIIGGYYNEKRIVHKFLLAVYKKDSDSESGKFYAVTSVVHGLSVQQRRDIQKKLEPFWQAVGSKKIGRSITSRDYIEWNKAAPAVWIEPKNSIILQIKASDMVVTNTYRTSHTFRFPRVIAVRDDKPWSDCCSLSEFEKFCSASSTYEKLTKRHATIDDVNDKESKPSSKKARHTEPTVIANNKVNVIDIVCAGLDFCILNEDKEGEMKNMIRKHGGNVVENPGPRTYACIADHKSLRVEKAVSSQKYNIATGDWLRKSFGGNAVLQSLPKFQPLEMMYATDVLQLEFKDHFDIYGDSYSEKITIDDFKAFSSNMDLDLLPIYTKNELYELEMELWAPREPSKIFRFLAAHFLPMQTNDNLNRSYELAQFMFTTRAGRILTASEDDKDTLSKLTHIFIYENDCDPAQCCEVNRKISEEHFIYNASE